MPLPSLYHEKGNALFIYAFETSTQLLDNKVRGGDSFLAQATPFSSSWQGSLRNLAAIINNIRRSHAFGRLTLRNTARLGVAHFYFRGGRLVHIVSNRGDAEATLIDLQ